MKILLVLALCVVPALCRHSHFVVGGRDVTDRARLSHQGALEFRATQRHTCGVSLVRPNWVITAAHCVAEGESAYQIRMGHTQRSTGGQVVNAKAITVHPGWVNDGSRGFPNDAAVIELVANVDTSKPNIKTIAMAPNDGYNYVGDECWISGWGRIFGGSPLPEILQEARVDALTAADCVKRWGEKYINPGHICIMGYGGSTDIGGCNGDSGGPLTCKRDGRWYVTGITSYVRTGCLTSYPTVYSRVSEFNAWISGIIGLKHIF